MGSGGLVNGVQSSSIVMNQCNTSSCVATATCVTGSRIIGYCLGSAEGSTVLAPPNPMSWSCQRQPLASLSPLTAVVVCQ